MEISNSFNSYIIQKVHSNVTCSNNNTELHHQTGPIEFSVDTQLPNTGASEIFSEPMEVLADPLDPI